MYASYVVRVTLESLEGDELVGIVEVVDTGQRVGFTGTDELLAVLRTGRRANEERPGAQPTQAAG